MKKLLITLVALFVIIFTSYAQGQQDLKGPRAKNSKFWNSKKQYKPVLSAAQRAKITGPEAKNRKPGDLKSGEISIARDARKSQLKGPAAKNYKPWK